MWWVLLLLGTLLASTAAAVDLEPGDLVVASNGVTKEIVRVDPVSGLQTTISSGGLFGNLTGVAMEPGGDILVSDSFLPGVIRVAPDTGQQSTLSSDGILGNPRHLTTGDIDVFGVVLVDFSTDGLVTINRVTGAQNRSLNLPDRPIGISSVFRGFDRLRRVMFTAGDTVYEATIDFGHCVTISGGSLQNAIGVEYSFERNVVYVADSSSNVIVSTPRGCNRSETIVSSGPQFYPIDIAIGPSEELYVADVGPTHGVVRVDPDTGNQQVVSSSSTLSPSAIAIVPAACGNRVDDDGDGMIDTADPECASRWDDSEAPPPVPVGWKALALPAMLILATGAWCLPRARAPGAA